MTAPLRFLLFICCLKELVGPCLGTSGPVFINPANQNALPQPSVQQSFVTQTVYGFLDFTTTIGNTVMIFSPQSASQEPQKKEQILVNTIIETKPSTSVEKAVPNQIKPTKIDAELSEKSQNKVIESKIVVIGASSEKPQETPQVISSKIEVINAPIIKEKKPTIISEVDVITESPQSIVSSRVEVYEETTPLAPTQPAPIFSSVVEIKTEEEPAVIIGNNIGEPEYDFLSRQPSEVVEETYKVVNLKPSSKFSLKPRASSLKNKANSITKRGDNLHPTGLVTKLGGTVVKDGVTTVHETSVIGTFISGKYAQVLQSTSHITNNHKHKINPSSSLRILKTAAPTLGKSNKLNRHLDPTPALTINEETLLVAENPSQQNQVKSTRKSNSPGSFKRFKNRPRESESDEVESEETKKRNRSQNSRSFKQHTPHREKTRRNKSQISPVSVSSEVVSSTASYGAGKRYNTRKNKQNRSTTTSSPENGFTRRGYKPKVQASTVDLSASGTSLYKFKLNRSPGRWQYKTSPKPRVTIRKQVEEEPDLAATTPSGLQEFSPQANDVIAPQARSDDVDSLIGSESVASIIDDESSLENKIDKQFPLETIKVEISTPPDFKDIYYEIATIKSPYTFQAGSVKNTRYITITSTFEKSLESTQEINPSRSSLEPLTENILASTSIYDKDNYFLDSSIGTLPPLYLASDVETPPLNTIIDTFSTTQTMLKTNVLPIIKGNNTSTKTLVQTYLITRMVTATKTLPPKEAYQFNPSKTLNEFNSYLDEAGSELHLELEFGDQNEQEDLNGALKRVLPGDLDLAIIGSDFNLSEVESSRLHKQEIIRPKPTIREQPNTPVYTPEQLQQLALLRLLNPAAAPPNQLVTASKPILKLETVYESHVIPIINGANTIFSTLSKIIGTVTKTEYELVTSTIPTLPLPPPVPVNPLFPQAQQQFAITSSPVVQTTVITQTTSKILKLTFGAKTAHTTIFSTKVIPTVLTSYMTASVAVPQTAAFPGYFPGPYPAFPFVG